MNTSLNFCNNLSTFPDSPILKCQKVEDTTNLPEGKDSESNRELQVNKTRYEADVYHVDTKVAKVSRTNMDPMTTDDLKEGEEVIGEQSDQMDTLMDTMEMTLTRVIIIITAVLYE